MVTSGLRPKGDRRESCQGLLATDQNSAKHSRRIYIYETSEGKKSLFATSGGVLPLARNLAEADRALLTLHLLDISDVYFAHLKERAIDAWQNDTETVGTALALVLSNSAAVGTFKRGDQQNAHF